MATREFEASYIYVLALKALEGIRPAMDSTWRDASARNYELHVKYVEDTNKWRRFVPFMKMVELEPFDSYVESRKKFDYCHPMTWHYHQREYDKKRVRVAKILDLAYENEKASRTVRMDEGEYRFLRNLANYSES